MTALHWQPWTHIPERGAAPVVTLSIDGQEVGWHVVGAPANIYGPFVWEGGAQGYGYYPDPGRGYTAVVLTSAEGHHRSTGHATRAEAEHAAEQAWERAAAEWRAQHEQAAGKAPAVEV